MQKEKRGKRARAGEERTIDETETERDRERERGGQREREREKGVIDTTRLTLETKKERTLAKSG